MIDADSGAAASGLSVADSLLLIAGSVVFGLPGWLAYAGRWRRWTTDSYRPPARYIVLGLPVFAVFVSGLMFCFWTPRRLRPTWYRDGHSPRKGRL